jgi:hypothetical protein
MYSWVDSFHIELNQTSQVPYEKAWWLLLVLREMFCSFMQMSLKDGLHTISLVLAYGMSSHDTALVCETPIAVTKLQ